MKMIRKVNSKIYTQQQQEILNGLISPKVGVRIAMEERLREMGPEGAQLLLDSLICISAVRKRSVRFFWIFMGGIGAVGAAIATALVLTHHYVALSGLSGLSGCLGLIGLLAPPTEYASVITALSQLDDKRAVGPLADALGARDINSRTAIVRALMRLLPLLTSEDIEFVTASQRRALQALLAGSDPNTETSLMLTLIPALAAIEDTSSLNIIEQLALRRASTENGRAVSQAANEALPLLQAAKQRQESPQVLLRASSGGTAPQQLLRPTSYNPTTPPEQLLRAGSGSESAE